jgi:hypothetical protein
LPDGLLNQLRLCSLCQHKRSSKSIKLPDPINPVCRIEQP